VMGMGEASEAGPSETSTALSTDTATAPRSAPTTAPRKRCPECSTLNPTASIVCCECSTRFTKFPPRSRKRPRDGAAEPPAPATEKAVSLPIAQSEVAQVSDVAKADSRASETADAVEAPAASEPATADDPMRTGRRARWTISSAAKDRLEDAYMVEPFPPRQLRADLGTELGVCARQVQVWFQNRRRLDKKSATEEPAAALEEPAALTAAEIYPEIQDVSPADEVGAMTEVAGALAAQCAASGVRRAPTPPLVVSWSS